MKNAELTDIVPVIKHLFWWAPESELQSHSPDAIVEAVLSNGNEDTVRQLFDYYGTATVAEIFKRQTAGPRSNYRPRTAHFFREYFHRHVPNDESDHIQKDSDGKSG